MVQTTGNTQPGGFSAGLASAMYQAFSLPTLTDRPDRKPSNRIRGTVTTAQRRNDILNWPFEAIPPTQILPPLRALVLARILRSVNRVWWIIVPLVVHSGTLPSDAVILTKVGIQDTERILRGSRS